jgi:hypothetical protein
LPCKKKKKMVMWALAALACVAVNGVPAIPDQWYAEIHGNTTSTVSAIPSGTVVIKQWYDYTNKRVRKDFDSGVTKVYDYKTLVDTGNEKPGGPGNNPVFPSPQGFKYRTDNIANTCCWVWLITGSYDQHNIEPETMEKFEVEKKAKDEGSDAKGEHWSSVIKFPFLQTDDWWFVNGTMSSSNTFVKIPKEGTVMSNGTFNNVKYGDVDPTVFDHPDSRPTFGKCKQCGVDDECPMWECMQ